MLLTGAKSSVNVTIRNFTEERKWRRAHYSDGVRLGKELPCPCLTLKSQLPTQPYRHPPACPAAPLTPCSALLTAPFPQTRGSSTAASLTISGLSHRLHPQLLLPFLISSVSGTVLPGPGQGDHVQVCSLFQASSAPSVCETNPSSPLPPLKCGARIHHSRRQQIASPSIPMEAARHKALSMPLMENWEQSPGRNHQLLGCSMQCSPVCPGL